jgi:hypothetical protein
MIELKKMSLFLFFALSPEPGTILAIKDTHTKSLLNK